MTDDMADGSQAGALPENPGLRHLTHSRREREYNAASPIMMDETS
jgi:hypothetical protein